jgi:hypothetical protein
LRRRRERVTWTLDHLVNGDDKVTAALANASHLDEDLEQEENDAEAIEQFLKNRSEADLRWERDKLGEMLAGSLYDASPPSSKIQALLGSVDQQRDLERPGRYRRVWTLSMQPLWLPLALAKGWRFG